MEIEHRRVLITGDPAKLPPDIRPLLDPAQPLPRGARFYEEQKTAGSIAWTIALGLGLIIVGLALIFLGAAFLIVSLIGLVFVVAGAWVIYTVRARLRSHHVQQAGQHTRYGIFLVGDSLVEQSEFGTTIIPRSEIQSLDGGKLVYRLNDDKKSIELPRQVVGMARQDMLAQVHAWRDAKV